MPNLTPVSRRELVRKLKALGFEGPFPGKAPMDAPERVAPDDSQSPWRGDRFRLIRRILRQAGIALDE
jgi:hypothetical protein